MATAGIKAAAYLNFTRTGLALRRHARRSARANRFEFALPDHAQTYEEAQSYAPNKTISAPASIDEFESPRRGSTTVRRTFRLRSGNHARRRIPRNHGPSATFSTSSGWKKASPPPLRKSGPEPRGSVRINWPGWKRPPGRIF